MKFVYLQLFSEKISGAEGTKLDEEFQEMERVRKVTLQFYGILVFLCVLCLGFLSYCRIKNVFTFQVTQ